MSFSSEVKAELSKNSSQAKHCVIAELSAMLSMVAQVDYRKDEPIRLVMITERSVIAGTLAGLIKRLFRYKPEASVKRTGVDSRQYRMVIDDPEMVKNILLTCKCEIPSEYVTGQRMVRVDLQMADINRKIVWQDCCKRAFVKGVFVTSGSISDPNKAYHMEIVCSNSDRAEFVADIMKGLGIDAKVVVRKKYHVVYIKDGEMIVDMLNLMGAHISLMNMENIRILKDISNNVNRRVNCEAANLSKTVNAAVKQIQDINFIIEKKGLRYLPENLRKLAEIRLEAPDVSLAELGSMMNPPIGKSGVNHRLRKISEIAEELR